MATTQRRPAPDHEHVLLAAAGLEQAALLQHLDPRAVQRAQRAALAAQHGRLETTGAHRVQRPLLPGDRGVDHQHRAARVQVRGRLGEQGVEQLTAVVPGVPGPGLPARRRVVLRGHVGRVGDDEVEALVAQRFEQAAAHGPQPGAVQERVEPRGGHRAPGQVHGGDSLGARQRGRHGDGAAAGAEVEDRVARAELLARGIGEHPRVRARPEDAGRSDDPHWPLPFPRVPRQTMPLHQPPPTAEELEAAFAPDRPMAIGLEEEVMLLDPETLDLAPIAREVVECAPEGAPLKLELPASQVEITTQPTATVAEAVGQLAEGRRDARRHRGGRATPACAGVHPFAEPDGVLNHGERYERTLADYGPAARQQLVCALQVHVAVGGPDRALAVYNALRSYLPEVAALAANAPWHAGRDTGLASIRPKLAEALPRQGVPPAISSWDAFAGELGWGRDSGAIPGAGALVVGAAPSPGLRDARAAGARRADHADPRRRGIAAFCHALVGWLVERHDAGEALPVADSWRIAREPLVGAALGRRGHVGRPGDRRAPGDGRPPARAGRRDRARRAAPGLRRRARHGGRDGGSKTARWLSGKRWPVTALWGWRVGSPNSFLKGA